MRSDSTLQKLEIYVVGAVAVVLVCGASFLLSSPFAASDYHIAGSPPTSSTQTSTVIHDSQPALLEPALRSLDGVSHHG